MNKSYNRGYIKHAMKFSVLAILLFCYSGSNAQSRSDTLFFKDRIQKVSEDNIFKTVRNFCFCSGRITLL